MNADILIVDDMPDNLRLLSSMLTDNGYRVRNAINGKRTFIAVQRQVPDLILLDIKMPDMDGYEVCHRLKASEVTRNVPIIFISALDDVFDKVKAFEVGGVDYITKPFQAFEVMARVGSQLEISYLQQQLTKQNQCLAEKNKQLSQEITEREKAESGLRVLLHAVSHDLRNPVTGLSLSLQSFLSEEQPKAVIDKPTLKRMVQSCARQLKLINSLVEVSQGQVWGVSLDCQLTSLHTLTSDLLAEWEPILVKHQVLLQHQVSPNLPLVSVDAGKLWRVFENLIANALKYNPLGFTLTLAATNEGDCIYCRVADDGVGIPAEQCQGLFDLYTRGTSVKYSVGLGLGLYLCRQIINAHGGQIGMESKLGKGTAFWFTLPLKEDCNTRIYS
ncbi:MAG: response regulator [Symploca sp. SIO2E9]|nr:response regulator [Symploca sp. SIO2E9]